VVKRVLRRLRDCFRETVGQKEKTEATYGSVWPIGSLKRKTRPGGPPVKQRRDGGGVKARGGGTDGKVAIHLCALLRG